MRWKNWKQCKTAEDSNRPGFFFLMIILRIWEFLHQRKLIVFHWSLSDCKSHKYYNSSLSLDSEWQEVSSGLLDSSESSSWFQQCCGLNRLDTFIEFHFFLSFSQAIWDRSKSTNYYWYHRLPFILQGFFSLARFKYLFVFSLSFTFTLWSTETAKFTRWKFFVSQHQLWSSIWY